MATTSGAACTYWTFRAWALGSLVLPDCAESGLRAKEVEKTMRAAPKDDRVLKPDWH